MSPIPGSTYWSRLVDSLARTKAVGGKCGSGQRMESGPVEQIRHTTETSMKKFVIRFIKAFGILFPLPFAMLLARKCRSLRFLVPPGKEFVYDKYLNGTKVRINTIYPIEVEMLTGTYDPITSAIIKKFVKKDSVVIDIGANVGALTLLMAKAASNGKVIAIEPGVTICSRLRYNIDLNPELRHIVEIIQVGISDRRGELFWKEDKKNRGNAGLLEGDGEVVKVDTLDHIVASSGLNKIDFIKIDVEGMEYEVIKGGMASIIKYRPLIYYETLEPFRRLRGFDIYGKIFNLLQGVGYQHFAVLPKGEIVGVNNLDVLYSSDILAMPKEKVCVDA